jgi:serine/threonine protein kinase/Tfp pilus assembly protein PilF
MDDPTVSGKVSSKPGEGARPALARGTTVGRYLLLDALGEGGMGVVYKAYDPELDRPIALKLLRTVEAEAGSRLQREAQALAKLQHPNVIAVYDVGTFEGDVFIAMEFVEGQNLRSWMRATKRSSGEILDAFLAAGEGLAAAHRAGLVHRDFKPDNVMVGNDGRVRVLDFGLARTAHPTETANANATAGGLERVPEQAPRSGAQLGSSQGSKSDHSDSAKKSLTESGRSSSKLLETPLTHVGAIVGTPRFMAPEQHLGDPADERADQFSFCVSLYWALYGAFPFPGANLEAVLKSVLAGRVAEPPAGANVPRWLRQVLLRGLARAPGDRFSSMSELLAALRADPWVARRRWLAAAAVLTLLAGLGLSWRAVHRRERSACAGAERRLAGVWDDSRRAGVRAAFRATGRPYAEAALATVERVFDGYARAWTAMHTDACEATQVRGEQSQELLDLRMTCLADRLTQLKTLSDLYAAADANVVERAPESAQSLPGLELCADTAALKAPTAPPRDPRARQQVEQVRERLARAHALGLAARYDEALTVARAGLADAERLKYPPLEAETQLRLGELLSEKGDYAGAVRSFHRGWVAALSGHHEEASAWIATLLIQSLGVRQGHYEEGDRWADVAEALVGRLQRKDELLGALYTHRSELRKEESRPDEAIRDGQRALEIEKRTLGPEHARVADTYHTLGNIYREQMQYAEALASFQQAILIRRKALGPDHPAVISGEIGIADVYGDRGEHERAIGEYRRLLTALTRAQPDHPLLANLHNNLATELQDLGHYSEAIEHFQLALSDWRRRIGPSTETITAIDNIGSCTLESGRLAEALEILGQGLEECERVLGAAHYYCGVVLQSLGEAHERLGRLDVAMATFQRSLANLEKSLGPSHPRVVATLLGIGRVYIRRHQGARARAPIERAIAILQARPDADPDMPELHFALAEALWLAPASPDERPRAQRLAEQARAELHKAGTAPARKLLVEVDAWLKQRSSR